MKKFAFITLALIGAASALSAFASPEPQRYEVSVRMLEEGRLLASPKIITTAGTAATFMSDDGTSRWSVKVTPSPAASPSGNAAVSLASDVEIWNGRENRRRVTTTVLLDEGETASLKVKPQGALPAVDVEIRVTSAPRA